MQKSFIEDKVIGNITDTLQTTEKLLKRIESRELYDMVSHIRVQSKLLQFHAFDSLDL